jgi:hypothetical protein
MPVSKRLLTFFLLAMKSRHEHKRVASFGFPQKISVGPCRFENAEAPNGSQR